MIRDDSVARLEEAEKHAAASQSMYHLTQTDLNGFLLDEYVDACVLLTVRL